MNVRARVGRVLGKLGAELARARGHRVVYVASHFLAWITFDRVQLIKYVIVAQPISAGVLPDLRPDRRTRIVRAEPDSDFAKKFPRPESVIRQRFDSGALCFSALVNDEFVGYIWLRSNGYEEDEVRCTYVLNQPQRSVWDFDVYVEPDYRFGRTLARLWQAVDRHLEEQGVEWTFSRISIFNPESLAAHAQLGAVACHSAVFLVVGAVQVSLLPQRPYLHVSLSGNCRPVLRLEPPRRQPRCR